METLTDASKCGYMSIICSSTWLLCWRVHTSWVGTALITNNIPFQKGSLKCLLLYPHCLLFLCSTFPTYRSDEIRSVAQSCPTLCDPMNCSTPGLPVHHQLPEFTQTHVHRVNDAIQPSHPLSSPSPSAPIPHSIRVFSNESTLRMRWPKYWSFSFSIIPS